ncbi:MAG: hypothetical protein HZB46_03740 [Solirubrobacterales bacterium]|nr:hypothetical protein [Solirubrobacterales bacterium]
MSGAQVVEHPAGISWVLTGEPMQRASHAVGDGDGVWLVDPVDEAGAVQRAQALGPVRAVVQLLDRHPRDCAVLAGRLGVPHLRLPDAVPGSPFEVRTVVDVPRWREKALWWPQQRALVVAELLGTNEYYRLGPGAVGIHPFLRVLLPGALRGLQPEVLLCGHGLPVTGPETPAAVEEAHHRARLDLVRTPLKLGALWRAR